MYKRFTRTHTHVLSCIFCQSGTVRRCQETRNPEFRQNNQANEQKPIHDPSSRFYKTQKFCAICYMFIKTSCEMTYEHLLFRDTSAGGLRQYKSVSGQSAADNKQQTTDSAPESNSGSSSSSDSYSDSYSDSVHVHVLSSHKEIKTS